MLLLLLEWTYSCPWFLHLVGHLKPYSWNVITKRLVSVIWQERTLTGTPIFLCFCEHLMHRDCNKTLHSGSRVFRLNAALSTYMLQHQQWCIKKSTLSLTGEKKVIVVSVRGATTPVGGMQSPQSVQWLGSSQGVSGWLRGSLEAASYRPEH